MEVHAHTHPSTSSGHRKKWTHYFWEFLMLFLAVFCGFLAEYQLEHKIEKDRAKELAKSLYQELKNDSVTAGIKVQNRLKAENALMYIIHYFKTGDLSNVPKLFGVNFLYGINFRSPSLFEPRTVILDQLINSGSLRYFKNEQLETLIGDLTVSIKNINDRQELEGESRQLYINPLIINHYDYDFDFRLRDGDNTTIEQIKNYETGKDSIPFQLRGVDKLDKERFINVLSFYKTNGIQSTRITFIQKYIELNAEILKELRKEYHIKK